MLELFTKKPVFQGNDEIHQLDVIYKLLGTPTSERWPEVSSLPWYELVKPKDHIQNRFRDLFQKSVMTKLIHPSCVSDRVFISDGCRLPVWTWLNIYSLSTPHYVQLQFKLWKLIISNKNCLLPNFLLGMSFM